MMDDDEEEERDAGKTLEQCVQTFVGMFHANQ